MAVVSGRDLPEQFHMGRRCAPGWVSAVDGPADSYQLGVKPSAVLWTAPRTGQTSAGMTTTWSDTYFQRGYDTERHARSSAWERLRGVARPERLWPVVADAAARIVHLESRDDLVAAAARWPTKLGYLSFESMAADGIDAVWVSPAVIPRAWDNASWAEPHARLDAQFYGWEIESVAWLRSDRISVGAPQAVDREPSAIASPRRDVATSPKGLDEGNRTEPTVAAAGQDGSRADRPALLPPGMNALRPERAVPSPDLSARGMGIPL